MAFTEYFTMPGHYWVLLGKILVGFYWPELERGSGALGLLAVLLLGLETELFKIVSRYPQLLE